MISKKENPNVSLLNKGKRGILSIVFSRLGIIIVLFIIQVLLLFSIFKCFEDFLPHIYGGSIIFTIFMILYLLNTSLDPTAKITWLIVIMLLPVFGALLFIYTRKNIGHKALKLKVEQVIAETSHKMIQDKAIEKELESTDLGVHALSKYIFKNGNFPVYKNTKVTYFPLGEDKFRELLIQLEKAENFIFLEYFIIAEGIMWNEILKILTKKAAQGVDVRVMYDGTCELSTLAYNYTKKLEKLGIKCKMFAPLTPFVSTHYNYRDHRKILVIDGHTAFTGGVNLADEYINAYEKYGHWKDTAIMLQGDAVRSFTLMFLQMWSLDEKNSEFDKFLETSSPNLNENFKAFVIPYGDVPLDNDKVGEQVYIDMLNRAKKYIYIMTPYLILDGELENSLKFAAKRGVDVRLILPGIPDKSIPYALALTHYRSLLSAGIKIYEYSPGFIHAKTFVSDDIEAVVGTINLDYRSLYHHFECASYMYNTNCIKDIKNDILDTITKCKVITTESIKNESFTRKITGFVMKALAPLL